MSLTFSRRLISHSDTPSTSGRCDNLRRVVGSHSIHRTFGVGPPHASRNSTAVGSGRVDACESLRPPAGPSTVLCSSSLGKERKKLAKVLKSHRKVLEKRLSALTRAEVEAPVLSELLQELRILNSRLKSQRAALLILQDIKDSDSSSSDSDEELCETRSAAALCFRRALSATSPRQSQAELSDPVSKSTPPAIPGMVADQLAASSTATSIVVSSLAGEVELQVPPPQEGWCWDEDEFRLAKFDGAGGRVMVCTGSKCQRKGGAEVLRAVSALSDGNPNIEVVPCKCVGKCSAGAALRVRPMGQPCATYTQVRPAQLREVFLEHFAATEVAPPPLPSSPVEGTGVVCGLDAAASSPDVKPHVTCCLECQQQ
ncbi:hypothetical protein VOLCADRAFT_103228 [Volvox carteri f. nagariensis]|uniref:Uncharacterized protein n=1 Tax=Volvox carteri f. nagariensis TaxID=3068 RepID=D8TKC1_VOLCA|nr:uncharacterized protein VOLCADRAFT_103228 [Volvox carteri f. nagariensis]EFJ52034.1 hypothetical protein VOLCADRAFT_103228 [Volvox carteri f. nagariensis]|eukprot:XP_002946808.1 hypothetical protein VOLCADRAFT_103228 [Volvox carteri f. nagariensis]